MERGSDEVRNALLPPVRRDAERCGAFASATWNGRIRRVCRADGDGSVQVLSRVGGEMLLQRTREVRRNLSTLGTPSGQSLALFVVEPRACCGSRDSLEPEIHESTTPLTCIREHSRTAATA